MKADIKPSKEYKRTYIWLPSPLLEKLDEIRELKKWDDPDKFRTRTHAICAAIEEFIKNES